MVIPIEKHVPLPPKRKGAEEIVPELTRMRVGDCILIPNEIASGNPAVSALGVGIYALKAGVRFETKYENGGLRVWRTE